MCQTVAVEAEENAVKPDPLVCEDQAPPVKPYQAYRSQKITDQS